MERRTERLLLREFVPEDWRAVLAYQSDPRYLHFYPRFRTTELDARSLVARFVAWQHEEPRTKHQLALLLPGEDRLIGNCGLRLPGPEAHQAELGYELSPLYWGQGYATEAARAMVAFGFTHLNLHRIWASCVAENERSARVLERVGLRCEGRLREDQWMKGRWWDTLLYGILEHEWRACVEEVEV
jgi:RimJ/RimL family protein N-acetyltransferase